MRTAPKMQYISFMLRLQWAQNDGCPTWVVSIQSTMTGELHRFPSLDALIQFLLDEFGDYGETKSLAPQAAETVTLPEKE
ncbi:MAG: hypothetical protein H6665_16015 [Ardenticatenaceae bacterium]|nr:hypothetical protein [Anaerolineales bacterium]MCB8992129.1 hypothetical protein [Ardenticatenaceae bacterium]